MTPRRDSRVATLVALPLALSLALVLQAPARADDTTTPTGPTVAVEPPLEPREAAEAALATVEEILESGPVDPGTSGGDGTPGKDLTLALRDLAAARADLPKADRATATRLLSRPTDAPGACADPQTGDLVCYPATATRRYCSSMVCIHWVRRSDSSRHGVPWENDGVGGRFSGTNAAVPDYVEFTLATVTRVAQRFLAAGYRPVAADGTAGGDSRPDIYLGQLGDVGVYGYCAPDDDSITDHVPSPGYCVLDNDYAEFGIAPTAALQVTAAHEYFHAVQFAYDVSEDGWIMEATASWVEDELYDGINDNRAYLPYGPLGRPGQSLDAFTRLEPYGTWIFFRYLSEAYPASTGGLPTIVRSIWDRLASGGPGNGNVYSLQGLRAELAARGTSLANRLAIFAGWNRRPGRYEEGVAYRPAPLRASFTLSPDRTTRSISFRLNRLATATHRFTRTRSLVRDQLSLRFDLNSRAIGHAAVVTVKRRNRPVVVRLVRLDAEGRGSTVAAFGRRTQWVEVTVVNGDARSRCWTGGGFANTCQGTPVASSLRQNVTASVTR